MRRRKPSTFVWRESVRATTSLGPLAITIISKYWIKRFRLICHWAALWFLVKVSTYFGIIHNFLLIFCRIVKDNHKEDHSSSNSPTACSDSLPNFMPYLITASSFWVWLWVGYSLTSRTAILSFIAAIYSSLILSCNVISWACSCTLW